MTKLWRAIEESPLLMDVKDVWRERLGKEFEPLRRFLEATNIVASRLPGLWATTPQHIKLLLEAYLENGKRNFDKARFAKLLSFLFEPSSVGHEKSDLRRRITLAPILTTFALRNHSAEENWCAEIDAMTMCWSYIHAAEQK